MQTAKTLDMQSPVRQRFRKPIFCSLDRERSNSRLVVVVLVVTVAGHRTTKVTLARVWSGPGTVTTARRRTLLKIISKKWKSDVMIKIQY